MGLDPPRRPAPVGARGVLTIAILVCALLAIWQLDLGLSRLLVGEVGTRTLTRFFSAALTPALDYEDRQLLPDDAPPLLWMAANGAWNTVKFATVAISLSVVLGLILGFFASTAWWAGDSLGGRSWSNRLVTRAVLPVVYASTRMAIAFFRSIHELLWATIFLAALGLNETTAILAITLPYTGTLAKIFSEMADEAPRDAAYAMRAAGASPLQVFCFGLLPRALPDVSAYAFYRYECALRSSAIMGFFGLQTLGYYIQNSFGEGLFRQGWTYLYTLILLIVVFDWWSGAVRRRFLA